MGAKSKSRRELESKHCVPVGLYPRCAWPPKTIKKLVCEKKLSPIFKGVEEVPDGAEMDECPICFLSYPRGLNRASCCRQEICTECFLQLKETPSTCSPCPFCNKENFHVVYLGPKSKAERQTELEELRKVEEAQERMRKEEEKRSAERDAQREKLRREAEEASAALSLSSEDPDTLSSASSSSNTSSNNANPEPAPPADPNYDFEAMMADQNHNPVELEQLMIAEAIRLSLAEPQYACD